MGELGAGYAAVDGELELRQQDVVGFVVEVDAEVAV